MFVQVGAGAEGSRAVGTRIRLLPAVGAGVFGEPGGHTEALAADPAAEGSQAAVDALVVLQMRQLAEALAASSALVEGWRKTEEDEQGKREATRLCSQQ